MLKVTTVCNICGKERGPSNHWHQAHVEDDSNGVPTFYATGWQNCSAKEIFDLCGAECAGKAFQRFLATGKLEAE